MTTNAGEGGRRLVRWKGAQRAGSWCLCGRGGRFFFFSGDSLLAVLFVWTCFCLGVRSVCGDVRSFRSLRFFGFF